MKMKKDVILPVVIASLVFAGAGFFGGMEYQKMQRGGFAGGQFGGRGANGQFRMMGGPGGQTGGPAGMNRPVAGDIIASDDKSITVKLQDGSSKIVLVNDQSTVTEATTSTKQSLSVGKKVLVFGTANSDGSVTAQNVQLNPQGNMMMFGQNRPNGGNGQGR
jgi:hypothetical protein